MIFGISVGFGFLFLFFLDYSAFYKRHHRAIVFEAVALFGTYVVFSSILLADYPLYSQGGRKVDIVILLWVLREVIQSRMRNKDLEREITTLTRRQAINGLQRIDARKHNLVGANTGDIKKAPTELEA
jgi:hypothetical protein